LPVPCTVNLQKQTLRALEYIHNRYSESPTYFGHSTGAIIRESSQLLVVLMKWSVVCTAVLTNQCTRFHNLQDYTF